MDSKIIIDAIFNNLSSDIGKMSELIEIDSDTGVILEVLDFKGKETKEAQYSQYLPKFKFKKSSNLVDIKANFDIINPLIIKNNFSNLSFDGRLLAFGKTILVVSFSLSMVSVFTSCW